MSLSESGYRPHPVTAARRGLGASALRLGATVVEVEFVSAAVISEGQLLNLTGRERKVDQVAEELCRPTARFSDALGAVLRETEQVASLGLTSPLIATAQMFSR